MALMLAIAAILLVALWLAVEPWLRARRRRALARRPFPEPWRRALVQRWPLYRRLPAPLRRRLEGEVQVFLAEKAFFGCAGFEITDEARLTIAAQACLLALNRPGAYSKLREVLVYPGPFVVERVRAEPSGVLQEQRSVLAGESWTRGQVILSWQDAAEGAAIDDDGRNVVIHEFAHQLDQHKGYANGAPALGSGERQRRWAAVLAREFAVLQERAALGLPGVLSAYGATDPAEFFAVASEAFIEQGRRMAEEHPALYGELRDCYGLDPALW